MLPPHKVSGVLLLLACSSLVLARASAQIAQAPSAAGFQSASDAASREPAAASQGGQPEALISGWSPGNDEWPADLRHGDEVTLAQGQPDLLVFFSTSAPSAGPVEFRYRLEDYDLEWTVTRERLVHYRRLPPGYYHFQLQAHTRGQPWSTAIDTLSVRQSPFFYQTWYAYLIVGLGIFALAAQLLSQHDQILKGQLGMVLDERNRIASDCHDTLMAGLAAISWQLEATAKLFEETSEGMSPAAQSCELARSMTAHCQAEARRIIWDLRDSDEVTNVLSRALSQAFAAHRLRDNVETTLEVEGNEVPLAPGAVHHLVCIGQEAVSNAIRHANSSHIRIALRYESDSLSLSVRDNGQGFHLSDAVARTGHFGIPVMEERARKLGGALRLTTASGAGTEVAVTVTFETINQPLNQQHDIVRWIGI